MKIVFVLFMFLSATAAYTIPIGIESECPPALGSEFPSDIREASQDFEKYCKEARPKLSLIVALTDSARANLSYELARDSSYHALLMTKLLYDDNKANETLAFALVFTLIDPTADKFFDFVDGKTQEGQEVDPSIMAIWEKWQAQAIAFVQAPERKDKDLFEKVDKELERRKKAEGEKKPKVPGSVA